MTYNCSVTRGRGGARKCLSAVNSIAPKEDLTQQYSNMLAHLCLLIIFGTSQLFPDHSLVITRVVQGLNKSYLPTFCLLSPHNLLDKMKEQSVDLKTGSCIAFAAKDNTDNATKD